MFRPRIRLPVLGYFAVAAPALLASLLTVEAMMGPPGPMPLATSAPLQTKKQVAAATTAPRRDPSTGTIYIVPVRQDAVLPRAAETTGRAAPQAETPVPKKAAAVRPPKKPKAAGPRERHDRYAYRPGSNVW